MTQGKIIIVHAGRHKTGTSAIQHFLFSNRDRLSEAGFYYPNAGFLRGEPAHHAVALSLLPVNKQIPPAAAQKVLRNFKREIEQAEGTVVVSSEQFQNVAPRRLTHYLAGWTIRPVIYLRDQLHYLISSYQQIVHARTLSLSIEEYFDKRFKVVYADMLDAWSAEIGRENVSVRVYDRQLLRGGNIVEDFIWKLTGEEASTFGPVLERDVNPSLGGPLLTFKRRINAHLSDDHEQQQQLYKPLSRLATRNPAWRAKPQLSEAFIARVATWAEADTRRLLGTYLPDGPSPFAHRWPLIGDDMECDCDPEEIMRVMDRMAPAAARYIRANVPSEVLKS